MSETKDADRLRCPGCGADMAPDATLPTARSRSESNRSFDVRRDHGRGILDLLEKLKRTS